MGIAGYVVGITIAVGVIIMMFYVAPRELVGGNSHGPTGEVEEAYSVVILPRSASQPDSPMNFEPSKITVVIGSNNKVIWINDDFAESTVLADDNSDQGFFNATHLHGTDSPTAGASLHQGEVFEYTFNKTGIYDYHCSIHPWMYGTVVVVEPEEYAELTSKTTTTYRN
ncbi:MAG: plastocyanin/azurin family copper-binding protein [Thermoproteota archaeon]